MTAKNTNKDDVLIVDLEDGEIDFLPKIVIEPKPEKEEEEKSKRESEIRTRIYVDNMSFLDHETEIHHSSPNNPMELQDQENDFQKKRIYTRWLARTEILEISKNCLVRIIVILIPTLHKSSE